MTVTENKNGEEVGCLCPGLAICLAIAAVISGCWAITAVDEFVGAVKDIRDAVVQMARE
nr:MAG TPA: hypothetical protein [Caudoviricetes sp.]